jgi:transcriptional pleiotropic regulator of transition state genes
MDKNEFKSTGIVRRIDDLGRVVIPKEVRRTMGLKEGDPLELFMIDDFVAFRKYDQTSHVRRALTTLEEELKDSAQNTQLDDTDRATLRALVLCLKKNISKFDTSEDYPNE